MLALTLGPNLHLIDAKNHLRLSFKSDLWYSSNRGLKYSPNYGHAPFHHSLRVYRIFDVKQLL